MKIKNSNLQVIWKLNYQEVLAVVNLQGTDGRLMDSPLKASVTVI